MSKDVLEKASANLKLSSTFQDEGRESDNLKLPDFKTLLITK